MPRFTHPDLKDVTLDAVLHALSDPGRRAIMQALAADAAANGQGLACAEAAPAHLPKSTMSHHYGVLRAAGLVRATKVGPAVIHTLRLNEVEARFPGVVSAILAAERGKAGSRRRRNAAG